MKKFEANEKGIQLFKSYGQRYYLLYEGKVPDLFAPTVRASLAAIKSKNTKNRMSTFYFIVDADEQIQGSMMAISGVARPETSSSLLGSKLKNAHPTMEFVPCLPNNVKLGDAQLDESVEDDNNRMDKIDLFIRFLIQLTSNLDKGEYQNLAQKFHLTDADTLNIRKIKALFGSEAFKQLFKETCEKTRRHLPIPKKKRLKNEFFVLYTGVRRNSSYRSRYIRTYEAILCYG